MKSTSWSTCAAWRQAAGPASRRTARRRCRSRGWAIPAPRRSTGIDYVLADAWVLPAGVGRRTSPSSRCTCRTAARSSTAGTAAAARRVRKPANAAMRALLRTAARRLRLLLLRRQPQAGAGHVRRLDAHPAARARQHAVADDRTANRCATTCAWPRCATASPASGCIFSGRGRGTIGPLPGGRPVPRYLALQRGAPAGDALWAGLPLLTCSGRSYAGRIGGSLLHAAGLPELVAEDLAPTRHAVRLSAGAGRTGRAAPAPGRHPR